MEDTRVAILKTIWSKRRDGQWGIQGIKGLSLAPKEGQEGDYFAFKGELELMTSTPVGLSPSELFRSFGSTDFLVKQSIVPIVAWVHDESVMRTIGTGFFVSCTGYLMTACHVLLDPEEAGYGRVCREGNRLRLLDGVHMGVLVRINPATGQKGVAFLPFENSWYWGDWKSSPLLHERDRFDMLTDIAVCKVITWPTGKDINHSIFRLMHSQKMSAQLLLDMLRCLTRRSQLRGKQFRSRSRKMNFSSL